LVSTKVRRFSNFLSKEPLNGSALADMYWKTRGIVKIVSEDISLLFEIKNSVKQSIGIVILFPLPFPLGTT